MLYPTMFGKRVKEKALEGLAPNRSSSEFEIDNWQISELVKDKIIPVAGIHPFPLNELMLMAGTIARFEPKLIFEWGTHVGKSARIFYEVCDALRLKAAIHSIDLPDEVEHGEHPHEQRGYMVKGIKQVKLHHGDGLDSALKILRDEKDSKRGSVLFFIDGDHSYESVRRELKGVMSNVPEAVILLHDTFYQSPDSKYNVGPHKAIEDSLKTSRAKYKRVDTATGLPGMTLLYKP